MAHPRIQHRLRKYMEEHPGATVYRDELMDYVEKENGLRPTVGGITSAMMKLVHSSMGVQIVDSGNSWRYVPNSHDQKKEVVKVIEREIFERVHITKGGAWIMEDTLGEVTVVKPIDL